MKAARDSAAALVTLRALASVLPADSPAINHIRLDGEELSVAEAVLRLAAYPKPLSCDAHVTNRELVVACAQFKAEELSFWLHRADVIASQSAEALRNVFGTANARLLIPGAPAALTVSLDEWELWERDYYLPKVGFAIRQRGHDSLVDDAVAAVEFWTVEQETRSE